MSKAICPMCGTKEVYTKEDGINRAASLLIRLDETTMRAMAKMIQNSPERDEDFIDWDDRFQAAHELINAFLDRKKPKEMEITPDNIK